MYMFLPFRIYELTTLDIDAAYRWNFVKNQALNQVLRPVDWRTIPVLVSSVAIDNAAVAIYARGLVK